MTEEWTMEQRVAAWNEEQEEMAARIDMATERDIELLRRRARQLEKMMRCNERLALEAMDRLLAHGVSLDPLRPPTKEI